eukprot:TRINITY_DN15865_c0_g1_i1.p1 TRINITY_DN15865_c0_g1~~TRINITY_DN15865_c0_g1_i1.p1  ORF type:complete len:1544 (+),score=453.01 TRINITY_DN15865_c0_g1_i1:92-4723(+)
MYSDSDTSSLERPAPRRGAAVLDSSDDGESLQIRESAVSQQESRRTPAHTPQTQQLELSATSEDSEDVRPRFAERQRRDLSSESSVSLSSAKLESVSDGEEQQPQLPRADDILLDMEKHTSMAPPPPASPHVVEAANTSSADIDDSDLTSVESVSMAPPGSSAISHAVEAPPMKARESVATTNANDSAFVLSPITPAPARVKVDESDHMGSTSNATDPPTPMPARDEVSKQTVEYMQNIESMLGILSGDRSEEILREEITETRTETRTSSQLRGSGTQRTGPSPTDTGSHPRFPLTASSQQRPPTSPSQGESPDVAAAVVLGAADDPTTADATTARTPSPQTQQEASERTAVGSRVLSEVSALPSARANTNAVPTSATPPAALPPPSVDAGAVEEAGVPAPTPDSRPAPTPQSSVAGAAPRAPSVGSLHAASPKVTPAASHLSPPPSVRSSEPPKGTAQARSASRGSVGSGGGASASQVDGARPRSRSNISVRSTRTQSLREAEQKRKAAEAAAEEQRLLQSLQQHSKSHLAVVPISRVESCSAHSTPESKPKRAASRVSSSPRQVPAEPEGLLLAATSVPSGIATSDAGRGRQGYGEAAVELLPRAPQEPQAPPLPADQRSTGTGATGRGGAATPRRSQSASSAVRMPSPVSPAGRFTKHAKEIVSAGQGGGLKRLEGGKRCDETYLRECIRQKEAARRERKNVMDDLNSFLEVYAGPSTTSRPPTPEGDRDDWERRRVLGKALFTRASGGTPVKASNDNSVVAYMEDERLAERAAPAPKPSYSSLEPQRHTGRAPSPSVSHGGASRENSVAARHPALSGGGYSARPFPSDPPPEAHDVPAHAEAVPSQLLTVVPQPEVGVVVSPRISPARGGSVKFDFSAVQMQAAAGEELRAESWRDAVRRRKDLLAAANGPSKLFDHSMALAKEKRKWAESERMKEAAKRNLEGEVNMTFNPKISSRSRSIDSSARRDVVRDQNTRLPVPPRPSPRGAARNVEMKQVFGRTTRERGAKPPPPAASARSSSAPLSHRITTLAQPKNRDVIEGVAAEVYHEQNRIRRENPIDDSLLRKREYDVRGQQVGHYLYNDGVEQMERKTTQEQQLHQERKSNSNVGKYLTSSSIEMANRRKRERLVQLFQLLDVAGTGRVTEYDVMKADEALKSVKAKIVDPKETAILQALTEAAMILKGSGCTEFTEDAFVAALEAKIGRSGPLAFMHPTAAQGKPKYNPDDGNTFAPRITERSREMATRFTGGGRAVHKRLFDVAAQQQAKREEQCLQREQSEMFGVTFKPKVNKVRKKTAAPPPDSGSPDDVLAHIDNIVGEAAEWLRGVSGKPDGEGRRSPSLSVSPSTPGVGLGQRRGRLPASCSPPDADVPRGPPADEVYDREGEYAPMPDPVVASRQRWSTHDGMPTHQPTMSPPRPAAPHASPAYEAPLEVRPDAYHTRSVASSYGSAQGTPRGMPPQPAPRPTPRGAHDMRDGQVQPVLPPAQRAAAVAAPPSSKKQSQRKKEVSLMSLRSASSTQLAAAGKLLMQQQLETHRFLQR